VQTFVQIRSHIAVAVVLGLLVVGCEGSNGDVDASAVGGVSVGGAMGCSKYPTTSRTDSQGTTWWSWYLHWQSAGVSVASGVNDLASFCATYGDGALMVAEVMVPRNASPDTSLPACTQAEIMSGGDRACAVAGAYRFEAPCGAGELLFELPSESAFNGFYHFGSNAVPSPPRHLIMQDVHCPRDLYVVAPTRGPNP